MIVACPKCKARYKVDDGKIGDDGLKLRCSKCQSVFKVVKRPGEAQAPAAPHEAPVAAPKPPPAPVQQRPVSPAPAAAKPVAQPIPPKPVAPPAPPPPPAPSPYVGFEILIAAESGAARDELEQVIKANQMTPILTADGIEALDIIKRKLPKAAILDVYLPKLLGFELCELVKNDDELKSLPVILLAAQLNSHRFKRSPQSLYGADGYLEIKDISTMTMDMLNDLLSGHAARKSKAEPDIFAQHEGLETQPESPEIAAPPIPPVVAPPVAVPPPKPPMVEPPKMVAPTPPPAAPVIPAPKPAAPSLPPQPQVIAPPQIIPAARPPAPPIPPPVVQAPPVAPKPRPVAPPPSAPVIPQAQAPVAEPELDVPPEEKEDHEKAKRLARIIVSDIQLYNQEAVMEGARNGNFHDLLAKDIGDARRLYTQRVPEHIRSKTNYLEDTLEALIQRKRKEMGLD